MQGTVPRLLRKVNKKVVFQVLCLTGAVAVGMLIPSRIAITVTPSLKHRIYIFTKVTPSTAAAAVKKGSYVNFMFHDPRISDGKTQRVMKRVACVAGEILRVEDNYYYCGNEFIGKSKPLTRKGEPLRHFVYNGIIPKGKVFVSGDHIDSYDSRYWGFLDLSAVTGLGHPIW